MILSSLIIAAAPLVAPPPVPWQEPAPTSVSEAAAPAQTAATVHAELRAELAEAVARREAAFEELRASDAWKAAEAARNNDALNEMYAAIPSPDHDGLSRRALEAAARFDGDPDQALLLEFANEWATEPEVTAAALEGLTEKHPAHTALFAATLRLGYRARSLGDERFAALAERVLQSDAPPETKANVLFARMTSIARSVRRGTPLSAEQQAAHDADRARILEIAPESIAAYRVLGERFEAERLQIGMVAPNILGTDLFGEPISLEQFRGQVVVIDFWGDW
ncbi:Thiol-disulfide oxidoreductase ResA [Planctomycetes bacterium Pla163]|uniref:Thiol-disulfide oxidoreductase ResA n=1 Tax=Rohdeia mirabilis TaxID=2528008 RepID=A0A518D0U4_9BACT|nr:Thiol-disulfide oxidoreductase ResA [Planctomycetes bacterium Pla163]